MNTIQVLGVHSMQDDLCVIEMDEFIPLSFKSYSNVLGGVYIQIGNHTTTLMDIVVDPVSRVLRGATLICFDSFAPWPSMGQKRVSEGLPRLSGPWDRSDHSRLDYQAISIHRDFWVSIRGDECLIYWGNLADELQSAIFGRMEFFFVAEELRGIRVSELSQQEQSLIASYEN